MRNWATPTSRHKAHMRSDLPMEECRDCTRAYQRCRQKRRFQEVEEAAAEARSTNIATEWALMLACYHCPYCEGWHLTKAKAGTTRWKRVEKQRRKWLLKKRLDVPCKQA